VCEAPGGVPCDDADPCTDDTCVGGVCENAPKVGIESLTCTCDRVLPDQCVGVSLPKSLQRYTSRACRLFDAALEASPKKQRRRLRQGARALRRAASVVIRAQVRGVAPECAAALADQFRATGDQATFLASQN
jgi:hypothetical protein